MIDNTTEVSFDGYFEKNTLVDLISSYADRCNLKFDKIIIQKTV